MTVPVGSLKARHTLAVCARRTDAIGHQARPIQGALAREKIVSRFLGRPGRSIVIMQTMARRFLVG
jgi:hypothetical protein